jgi:hypothetical protein
MGSDRRGLGGKIRSAGLVCRFCAAGGLDADMRRMGSMPISSTAL